MPQPPTRCSLFQMWRHNNLCTWAGHTSQPQLNSFCIFFSFIEVGFDRGKIFNSLKSNLEKRITRQKYGVGYPQEPFYPQFLNSAHCLRGPDKILLEKGFLKLQLPQWCKYHTNPLRSARPILSLHVNKI